MTFGAMNWQATSASLVGGYLLGSIPFGLIFAWLAGAGDVRNIGSGSIGATNVLRTGKYWAAAATLVFDAAKGATAVLLAQKFLGDDMAAIAAVAVVLGHLFPIWLRFKGGKGIATAGGVLLALYWPLALLAGATWLAVALCFRISSLSSLCAAVAAPLYAVFLGRPDLTIPVFVISILVVIMHRENIARLLRGEEPRIGAKKPSA
jgi:acyl phosphate:glycerol-3-phosphate acyltransferase